MLIKTTELSWKLKYDINKFKVEGTKIFDVGSFQNLTSINSEDLYSAITENKDIYEIFSESIITDADFVYMANLEDPNFLDKFKKSITSLINDKKTNLKFIDIIACNYIEFRVPWNIQNEKCDFSMKKAIEWIRELKEKNLYRDNDYILMINTIENILSSDKLSIGDLVVIEDMLEPYGYVRWKYSDIMLGYKIFNGHKYIFSECIREPKTIINCYYKHIKDYIPIDITLVDRKKNNNIKYSLYLYPYYTNNWYKILKSYKKFVDDKDDFFKKFNSLRYRPLLAKVDFILHMKRHRYLDNIEISRIENNFRKTLSKDYRGKHLKDLRTIFQQELDLESKILVDYFRENFKQNSYMYNIIEDTLNIDMNKIDVDRLEYLNDKGVSCPFSRNMLPVENIADDDVLGYLYSISDRILYDRDFFVRCISSISGDNMVGVVNKYFSNIKARYMYMIRNRDKILVKGDFTEDDIKWFINNNGVSINNSFLYVFNEVDMKKIQLYLLF